MGSWVSFVSQLNAPLARRYLRALLQTRPPEPLQREVESVLRVLDWASLQASQHAVIQARWNAIGTEAQRAILAQFTPHDWSDIPPRRYPELLEYIEFAEQSWAR